MLANDSAAPMSPTGTSTSRAHSRSRRTSGGTSEASEVRVPSVSTAPRITQIERLYEYRRRVGPLCMIPVDCMIGGERFGGCGGSGREQGPDRAVGVAVRGDGRLPHPRRETRRPGREIPATHHAHRVVEVLVQVVDVL